jgi:hypothetical protein
MGEAFHVEVLLSLSCRLLIPVGSDVIGGIFRILGGVLVVFQLLDKPLVRKVVNTEIFLRFAQGVLLTHRTEREMSGGLRFGPSDTADRYESGGGQDGEMLLIHNSEMLATLGDSRSVIIEDRARSTGRFPAPGSLCSRWPSPKTAHIVGGPLYRLSA